VSMLTTEMRPAVTFLGAFAPRQRGSSSSISKSLLFILLFVCVALAYSFVEYDCCCYGYVE
jgi:hypothetical protein